MEPPAKEPALSTKSLPNDADKASFLTRLKRHVTPNRSLLRLKATIFLYCASAFCILPYLTIHMKVKMLSEENGTPCATYRIYHWIS